MKNRITGNQTPPPAIFTVVSLSTLCKPSRLHLAQAKCYAAIYIRKEGLKQIHVQLTYCHIETETQKQFVQTFYTMRNAAMYEKFAQYILEVMEKKKGNCENSLAGFCVMGGFFQMALISQRISLLELSSLEQALFRCAMTEKC